MAIETSASKFTAPMAEFRRQEGNAGSCSQPSDPLVDSYASVRGFPSSSQWQERPGSVCSKLADGAPCGLNEGHVSSSGLAAVTPLGRCRQKADTYPVERFNKDQAPVGLGSGC